MNVLWFSIAPSLKDLARGGSWIGALKDIVKGSDEIDLSIAFVTADTSLPDVVEEEGVRYYPIKIHRNYIQRRYIDIYSLKQTDKLTLAASLEVVNKVKPDVIHVFGSEWCFGELSTMTKVPIVIHMQGCWPPYRYVGGDEKTQFFSDATIHWYNPHHIFRNLLAMHGSEKRALREESILRHNTYFMCRTRWDKAIVRLYNPNAKIFHCEEALRKEFVECNKRWKPRDSERIRLITVGLNLIKGVREIITAAKLLTDNGFTDFDWDICGLGDFQLHEMEKQVGIKASDVNVHAIGKKSAEELTDELINSDFYVHASHIDNSPNAVCEAQYLGLPIISTNVGGIPSLFDEHYPQDYLVPGWDPYYLAAKIKELASNKEVMLAMSDMNYTKAHNRHDPKHIYTQLVDIYREIANK